MDNKRYKEIKQENDQILSHLTGNYQYIANIYVKKARGYAVRNIDTEIKIKDVLVKLEDDNIKHVPYHVSIPDDNKFINDNIQVLSKQYKDPDRIKTIIGVSVIALCIIAWVVISIWMRQKPKAPGVKNPKCELISENQIKVTWDEYNLATNGYLVWMEDINGNIVQGKYNVNEEQYIFTITEDKEYIFCIQVQKNDYYKTSDPVKIKYLPQS